MLKLFISFDGNFDVIASKKLLRPSFLEGVPEFGLSGSRHVSAHVLDDGDFEEPLPPDSEAEDEQGADSSSEA